jgi:type IV pilus assembly protein PilQ
MSAIPLIISKSARRVMPVLAAAALLLGPTSAGAKPARNSVSAVDAGEADTGATTVAIRGSRTPTFTVYKLKRPSRVVVDIANAELAKSLRGEDGTASFDVNSWGVSQVSAHSLDGSQSVVRVVVRMARSGTYKVKAVGNDVIVEVTPRDAPPKQTAGAKSDRDKSDVTRARADAKRARADAKRARAEANEALARAEKMVTQARGAEKRARADANKARLEASQARAAARKARDDANHARNETEEIKQVAAAREAEADRRIAKADALARAAEQKLADARKTKAEAEAASKAAETASATASSTAKSAQGAAEKARAEAKRLHAEAVAAAKAGRSNAKQLKEQARVAAETAERRRRAAEKTKALADERASEAEAAATVATKQRKAAVMAATRANAERKKAEQQREEAHAARVKAEAELASARDRLADAEQAAADTKRKAAVIDRTATAAIEKAKRAESEAARLRTELAGAEARAKALTDQRDAAVQEATALRTASRATEARLVRMTRQVATSRAELAKLELERERTNAEVAKLEKEREELRAARVAAQQRVAAAEAKAARADEGKRAAEAKASRAAVAERAAVAKADAATREADALRNRPAAKTAERAAKAAAAIREVDFIDKGTVSRVVINLDGPAKPKVLSAKGTKAILEIPGAAIDADLERTLDTTRYGGPITAVSSYKDPRDPNKVRIVVDLNTPTASALKRKGTVYYWDFDKPAQASAKVETTTAAPAASRKSSAGVGTSTPITSKTVAQSSRRRKVYRGRKIDLDFKDADIHNLLRLLADVGGVNIVIPDEIRASVTVRLRNVPWDQALEVILQSKGLWYRREGSLIRIAARKVLDAEDKAEAERVASLARSEAPEPQVFTLNYAVANQLRGRLRPLLSPKGRIEVDSRTNSLIINDIGAHRRRIIDLVEILDTQTPQIQIEARIVEARSSFQREFGIQWGGRAAATQARGNSTGLVFPSDVEVAGAADDGVTNGTGVNAVPTDFAVNLPAAIGTGSGGGLGFAFGSVGGNFNINLRLSAAEDTGSIRIVSAPKITTLNNSAATISQGVSIPISVISANGVQTQFVPADLSLSVTPHVSQRDCSIAMDLKVTKNEADFANTGARGDPSILRKEAKTSILVADGETSVIGGIYTRSTGWSRSKVPFFADLPFIGWLFRNKSESDERTEVLVFVTPKITNRAFLRCE